MYQKIIIIPLLTITTLSAECTEEQITKMIRLNISSEIIEKTCNDIIDRQTSDDKIAAIGEQSVNPSTYSKQDYKTMYIGFGISNGSGKQTRSYSSGGSYMTDYDTKSKAIKIGHILASKNRIEWTINTIDAQRTAGNLFSANSSDQRNSTFVGLDFDWLVTFRNKNSIQPYLGLGLGVYKNNDIYGYYSSGAADTATGLALNALAGATYHFDNMWELEAGLKYKHIGWNLDNPKTEESIRNIYIGTNIKF